MKLTLPDSPHSIDVIHDGAEDWSGWTMAAVRTVDRTQPARPRHRVYLLRPAITEDYIRLHGGSLTGDFDRLLTVSRWADADASWKRIRVDGLRGAPAWLRAPDSAPAVGWHLACLWELGRTPDGVLAARYGTSKSAVQRWRTELQIRAPRGRPRTGPRTMADYERHHPGITALVVEGASAGKLGAYANKSRSWGGKVLKAHRESSTI